MSNHEPYDMSSDNPLEEYCKTAIALHNTLAKQIQHVQDCMPEASATDIEDTINKIHKDFENEF